MRKNYLSLLILLMFFALTSSAQRTVDKLDRGVVAVKTTKGVFVSWRIQSEEYYGVTYNLYRNGTKIA
ncbi:MAG: rhamnogalacturonan lyase, partial [Prevotella sp.]|nr:rhamnogalacturonan lyase [Prevotella sp.]